MTYILGWKSNSEVFLTADSALTTRSDSPKLDLLKSSFGQEHVLETDRKVEERSSKLFLKENIGVAMAGRYDLAIQITSAFYGKIEEGLSPRDALGWAVFLNSPFPKDATAQLAVAYFDSHPKLLSFNSQGDYKIRNDEKIIHLGSAPPKYKVANEAWLADILPRTKNQPGMQISSVIGVLQSHGVLNPTLQAGIGGAFCGLYIGEAGGSWQPDILFIEEDKLVSTCVRNNCLVVSSPIIGESRCFLTYLPPRSVESLKEQTAKAIEEGRQVQNSCKYDYAFLINTKVRTLTLIQMDKNLRHDLLWLEPYSEGGRSGTKIIIFPYLRKILDRKGEGLVIARYKSPSMNEVPKEKTVHRKIDWEKSG